jgi:hypothetical protein
MLFHNRFCGVDISGLAVDVETQAATWFNVGLEILSAKVGLPEEKRSHL